MEKINAVITGVGAIQGQDYAMAKWAVGIRLKSPTLRAVEDALARGEIIRTHVMRPTWHLVAAEDIRWMLKLSAQRIKSANDSFAKGHGVDISEALFSRCNRLIEKLLEGNKSLTKQEIEAGLANEGMTVDNRLMTRFMARAEVEGIVCSGVDKGKKATYGDFVWINYTQKSLTGSIIDSSDPSVAVGAGVSPYYTLGGPILMQMNTDAEKYIDPLSDILMNIPEGTTGSSIVSSIMSLSSALVYRDYTVESIVEEDNLLDYEKSMIGRYFADNNLDVFKEVPLHEGKTDTVALIAKTKENASGVFVQATDSVTVWAEGRILDELNPSLRQFLKMDSDDVVTWYLPDMIKGISLTLPELKVGEEATILFSSGMGYGYRGSRNYDGTYVVPAYSTLLFKVKIVDTKENPKKDK